MSGWGGNPGDGKPTRMVVFEDEDGDILREVGPMTRARARLMVDKLTPVEEPRGVTVYMRKSKKKERKAVGYVKP